MGGAAWLMACGRRLGALHGMEGESSVQGGGWPGGGEDGMGEAWRGKGRSGGMEGESGRCAWHGGWLDGGREEGRKGGMKRGKRHGGLHVDGIRERVRGARWHGGGDGMGDGTWG